MDLGASDELCDFPVVYASGEEAGAGEGVRACGLWPVPGAEARGGGLVWEPVETAWLRRCAARYTAPHLVQGLGCFGRLGVAGERGLRF